jgi:DNA-binding NarL/FixJ family response regulator
VLLDLSLPAPGRHRDHAAHQARVPSVGIIALAVAEDEDQLFEAIKAGAAAFILKDIDPTTWSRSSAASARRVPDQRQGLLAAGRRQPRAQGVPRAGRLRPGGGADLRPLSPREVEILDNIAKGMTNKQVAYALSISEQTVKNHMSSILRKLSVNDRTQAVVYAMKQVGSASPRTDPTAHIGTHSL